MDGAAAAAAAGVGVFWENGVGELAVTTVTGVEAAVGVLVVARKLLALPHGRTVASNSESTKWSMGCTMKGTAKSPAAVGPHITTLATEEPPMPFTNSGFGALRRPSTRWIPTPVHFTTWLMTRPGIATEARSCQANTSAQVKATAAPLDPGAWWARHDLSTVSPAT